MASDPPSFIGAAPQDGGIRGPLTASPGGSITINVGPNDKSVEVTDPTTGKSSSYDVEPGKDTSIPMPVVPGGTFVHVRIGMGADAHYIVVEIISTGP